MGWLFIATDRMHIPAEEAMELSPGYINRIFASYLIATISGRPERDANGRILNADESVSLDQAIPV